MIGFLVLPLLVLTAQVSFSQADGSNYNVICYHNTGSANRTGDGEFVVEDIDVNLCTHLIYAFVGIDDYGNVVSLDPDLDLPSGKDNFNRFNALKKNNTELKTLLAVGGWNEGSAKYSTMAASSEQRQNFTNSALEILLTYGFDGFDIDWEYPNRRDSTNGEDDIVNFTTLLKELKAALSEKGLLLTAAVSAVKIAAELSYNITEISEQLDLVNVMTYDLYGAWDTVTGHNAGLHKGEGDGDTAAEDLFTVDVAIDYWLAQGCPAEKIVIGLPIYGRTFNLTNSTDNGVRAPSSGAGIAGPYTNESGVIGYNEFCNLLQTETWDLRNDSLAKVPYAVQGYNWVSYDNPNSLTEKILWGLNKNITSVMLWSIDLDDFNGICGEPYPMLTAINSAFINGGS